MSIGKGPEVDDVEMVRSSPSLLDRLREKIRPEVLAEKGFPRLKDVQLYRQNDSTGEDSLYVYLVFPNKTPDRDLAWEKVEPMVSWVQDLLWKETDGELWPYVNVGRQKELAGRLV